MKWRTILAVGAVLLMLILQFRQPGAAYACLCQSPAIEANFDAADAVFQGEVVDIKWGDRYHNSGVATFNVSRGWKGSYQTMVVHTGNHGSCTDYPFIEGREYIVFASSGWFGNDDTTLYTSICGFTDLASDEMLAELRLISREQPTLADGPPPAADLTWVWLLLAAGALATVIWRWRWRRARDRGFQ